MNPIISIVIPVYNSGKYLQETIDSIKSIKDNVPYEIIIVNDGSTDQQTISILEELKAKGYNVLDKINGGPASARNTGIKTAKGKYILPVDSDDKIRTGILKKSIDILESAPHIGVVYCDAWCFGDGNGDYLMPEFSLTKLFYNNFFLVSSVFRKSIWEKLNGFDEAIVLKGIEDWDFWLNIAVNDYKIFHLNEILYEYRIFNTGSMRNFPDRKKFEAHIMSKHVTSLYDHYRLLYEEKQEVDEILNDAKVELKYATANPIKFFIKSVLYKMFSKKTKNFNNYLYKKSLINIFFDR